ncbi:DUF2867 domain-containing protein [Massilia sp. YIM B04103]|uniref:DUF2867 domain-containing protein n=1 Tax=Massilia sp. YIM B04103 TaxID=2963106 RepID=UPI002109D28E|nr:DUF2867 domain-containing protein [Massilia sp. YIM B04103]
MQARIVPAPIPADSEIKRRLPGADFQDCYTVPLADMRPPLELYLHMLPRMPRWVSLMMALRNKVVGYMGLKNLGDFTHFDASRPLTEYRVGDQVGIFSIVYLSEREIILGDDDKHLNVQLSLHRPEGSDTLSASTIVHIHNRLGHLYMFFVTPMHKLIVPAVLRRV